MSLLPTQSLTVNAVLQPSGLTQFSSPLTHTLVVVVDVLRATSTMIAAMINGATTLYPVATVDEGFQRKATLPNAWLIGEVNSVPPKGFDGDNSPTQFLQRVIAPDQPIIIRSTNGTGCLLACDALLDNTSHCALGSFVNRNSLADAIVRAFKQGLIQDVVVVCSGSSGAIALEDVGFAGALFHTLQMRNVGLQWHDAARVAFGVWESVHHDPAVLCSQSNHTKELIKLDKWADVEWIIQAQSDIIPYWDRYTKTLIPLQSQLSTSSDLEAMVQ